MLQHIVLVLALQHVTSAYITPRLTERAGEPAQQSCPLFKARDCASIAGFSRPDDRQEPPEVNDPDEENPPDKRRDLLRDSLERYTTRSAAPDPYASVTDGGDGLDDHVARYLQQLERRDGPGQPLNRTDDVEEALDYLERHIFARKTGKSQTYDFCRWFKTKDDKEKDVIKTDEMSYKTPSYPHDNLPIYDNKDWDKCDNFEFGKVTTKNKGRIALAKNEGEAYPVEHILERQLLKEFLDYTFLVSFPAVGDNEFGKYGARDNPEWKHEDPAATAMPADDSYCKYIKRYWPSVKLADPNNKNKQYAAFEYVARAYPNTKKWGSDEMFIIEAKINGLKARAFKARSNLRNKDDLDKAFDLDKTTGKPKPPPTTQPGGKPPPAQVPAWAGAEDLTGDVKHAILLLKYMNNKEANKIFKDQADRVGQRFKEAEAAVVTAYGGKYKSVDLGTQWGVFIKAYTTYVNSKIETALDLWVEILEHQVKLSKDPQIAKTMQKSHKDLVEKMEKTIAVAKGRKTDTDFENGGFKNPF